MKSFYFSSVLCILFFYFACATATGQTVTFNYTGLVQTWVVPPCVTSISVTMAGADGGGTNGGNGAVVTGTLNVTPGQTLNIYVGGSGNCPGAGWNGGGVGQNANSAANRSCGGGGATDIRIGGTGLANRVMVAAGGGGTGGGTEDAAGGNGGCATGVAGSSPFGQGGGAASQSAGGSAGPPWIASGNYGTAGTLGQGGNGGTDPCYNNSPGGGGGGGYYGGGGGGSDCYSSSPYGGGSGGGGSSLTPAGGGCNAGSNNGPGYVTITYVPSTPTATPSNTGPYCVGQTIQLNAGGTGTYSWTGPNGFTSTAQNPTLPATLAAAGNYSVTITNNGCSATGSTSVTVNPGPTVNAGVDQTVCQGAQVTLTGTGATSYAWNNGVTQGVAFSPPVGTTVYTVTGTTSGCTGTDQVSVTVNPLPAVNAGADQTVCQGSQVTLTGTGATSYSWNNGVSQGVAFTPPAGTTTYTVTGTTNGCSATDQVAVTVNPNPVVNAGTDQTVCQGTQVTLTGTGATSYSWNNGVSQGVAFTPGVGTTTYTVTGTTNGCNGTDQVVVTVNPNPVVNAGADQTVCQGTPVTLTATGAASYSWNNGVTQGTAFTPPVGTTVYTVTGTTSGCTGTDQVSVTVNPFPVVDAGPDQAVCQGTQVTLTASGGSNYSWNNGVAQGVAFTPPVGTNTYTVTSSNGGCSGSDQVVVTVTPNPVVNGGADQTVCEGTQVTLSASGASGYVWNNGVTQGVPFTQAVGTVIYTVTATQAGCTGSDQVSVTVNAIPVVDAGPDAVICAGTYATLTASGANSYLWSPGGAVTASVTVSPAGTTVYTVTGTSGGCSSTDQATVTVNQNPVVNAGTDLGICIGESATLMASGAGQYTWSPGGQSGASWTVTPAVTTVYTVSGTDNNGCSGSDNVTVTVNALPQVEAGNNQTICQGQTVILTAVGEGTLNWQGGIINGQSFTPQQDSWYYVTATNAAGCVNSDSVYVSLEYAAPASFTQDTDEGCIPLTVNFTNTTPGTLVNCVWWINGTQVQGCGTVSYTFNDPGYYDIQLTTTSVNGCQFSLIAPQAVYAAPYPEAEFTYTPENLTEMSTDVDFINLSSGAVSYSWDLGDGTHSAGNAPHHTYPLTAGSYMVELTAISEYGCVDTVTHPLVIAEELLYFVPNSFTPDGDYYNQSFKPIFTSGFDPYDYHLTIFNRWGEILFESYNAEVGWDGTYAGGSCQQGTYTWRIEFKVSTSDKRVRINGHVNLLR